MQNLVLSEWPHHFKVEAGQINMSYTCHKLCCGNENKFQTLILIAMVRQWKVISPWRADAVSQYKSNNSLGHSRTPEQLWLKEENNKNKTKFAAGVDVIHKEQYVKDEEATPNSSHLNEVSDSYSGSSGPPHLLKSAFTCMTTTSSQREKLMIHSKDLEIQHDQLLQNRQKHAACWHP